LAAGRRTRQGIRLDVHKRCLLGRNIIKDDAGNTEFECLKFSQRAFCVSSIVALLIANVVIIKGYKQILTKKYGLLDDLL